MKKIWDKWVLTAEKIGNIQMEVIFSILYFILLTPVSLISSTLNDYFQNNKKGWNLMEDNSSTMEKIREQ